MKPAIAFFDFDGTTTKRDTLFEIIRFQKGESRLYAGLFVLAPALVLFKMKLVSNQKMKELFLQHFFKNTPADTFRERCKAFCKEKLPSLVRESALQTIKHHLSQGHKVVVVTASAEEWVAPWCESLGIGCIGTRLEIRNAAITGRIHGENCNGAEKAVRIREQFDLSKFGDIYAYGDTSGDKQMLQLATNAYYRKFN